MWIVGFIYFLVVFLMGVEDTEVGAMIILYQQFHTADPFVVDLFYLI